MKFLNDMVLVFFYILGGRGSGGTLNNVFRVDCLVGVWDGTMEG